MILTDVSDTIHADSLALFALNIEILLADVTKPEKSKILTLTWPVTLSVTSGSNFWPCTGSSRTGLSNGVWNLEIGPVVWEISGGALWPPPPSRTCYYPDPSGARVKNGARGGDSRKPFLGRSWRVTHDWPFMTWDLLFWHNMWHCCPERYNKFSVAICFSFGDILQLGGGGAFRLHPPNGVRVNPRTAGGLSHLRTAGGGADDRLPPENSKTKKDSDKR